MIHCNPTLEMRTEQDRLKALYEMTPNEIQRRFPRASKSFIERNVAPVLGLQNTQPQPAVLHDPLAADKGKEEGFARRRVSITSYRIRACDTDNLIGGTKFLTDALKACGVIQDDSPAHIVLEVRQEKVAHRKDECTVIEIG